MTKEEFKKEYLTDAFFFVDNEGQFQKLQEIGVEFGLTNHTGTPQLIKYDMYDVSKSLAPKPGVRVAKNITFFPKGYFQESSFWVRDASYGEPKEFQTFLRDYGNIGR